MNENKYLKIIGTKATVMHPVTKVAKKVDKKEVRKYVQKGWIHMTQKKNQLRKEEAPANAGVDLSPGKKPLKRFKEYAEEKNGKEVPNCVPEEVAANSVAGGGVDMNPTGKPKKMDKRSKFHVEKMYKRNKG